MKPINIPGLERYEITEDGQIYSHRKRKWLKPSINGCGYIMYSLFNDVLNKRKFHMASRLVCYTYVGNPPTEKHEVDHIDHNRQNNHYTNLQWLTKSENILRSYRENNRSCYWLGKTKPSPGIETRIKMSNAKMKRVAVYQWGKYLKTYESVELLCEDLGLCRRTFNRILLGTTGKLSKRFMFKFIDDDIVSDVS
jgi:hypothetical protein